MNLAGQVTAAKGTSYKFFMLEIQLILAHRRINVHQDQILCFKSVIQRQQQVSSEDLAGPVTQNLNHQGSPADAVEIARTATAETMPTV